VTIIKCLIFSQPMSGKYNFLIAGNVDVYGLLRVSSN
jgi:hypothetical protein